MSAAEFIKHVHNKIQVVLDGELEEDFGSQNYRPYNRGNKLKRLMEQPAQILSKPALWTPSRLEEDGEYLHFGKQRAIIRKGRVIGLEEDPYQDIKIEEIWSLVIKSIIIT